MRSPPGLLPLAHATTHTDGDDVRRFRSRRSSRSRLPLHRLRWSVRRHRVDCANDRGDEQPACGESNRVESSSVRLHTSTTLACFLHIAALLQARVNLLCGDYVEACYPYLARSPIARISGARSHAAPCNPPPA